MPCRVTYARFVSARRPAVFERRLRVSDAVIKFQTVRVDEEMKRVAKLQQARAKKLAKKKPKPGAEPAAAPA